MAKSSKICYIIIRVLTAILFAVNLVGIIISKDFSITSEYVFIALNAGILFGLTFVPNALKKFRIAAPNFLLILFLAFVTAAQLLGEIGGFFKTVAWWDDMLHLFSGGLIALVGVSLINILNHDNKQAFNLRPIFVAVFAFCFAMTIGVLWEILEYVIDGATGSNMQRYKDSITDEIWFGRAALKDTMTDFILNSTGALIFSVVAYIDLRKESRLIRKVQLHMLPSKKQQQAMAFENGQEQAQQEEVVEGQVSFLNPPPKDKHSHIEE